MSPEIALTSSVVDHLLEKLGKVAQGHLPPVDTRFDSDVTVLQIAVSLLTGFVGSVAANQVPAIQQWLRQPDWSRQALHELLEELRSNPITFRLETSTSSASQETGIKALPDTVPQRPELVKDAFDVIVTELTSGTASPTADTPSNQVGQ